MYSNLYSIPVVVLKSSMVVGCSCVVGVGELCEVLVVEYCGIVEVLVGEYCGVVEVLVVEYCGIVEVLVGEYCGVVEVLETLVVTVELEDTIGHCSSSIPVRKNDRFKLVSV